jgi:hypothetical protein
MTAMSAISRGARSVNAAKRMIVLAWLGLLLVAAVAAAPAINIVATSLGRSHWAADLMRGLDPSWITEVFLDMRGYLAGAVALPAGLAFGAAILGQLLAAGGALSVLTSEDRRFTAAKFFGGCGRYFWRYFRLFLLSLFFYAAAYLVSASLPAAANRIWGEGMRATPLYVAGQVRNLVAVSLFILVGMVFDYAKIRLVVKPDRSVLRAARQSIAFVAGHFRACAAIWLVLIALGVLFYLVYDRLASWAAAAGAGGVLGLLFAQQAFILSRIWLRFLFWGAQAEYFLGTVAPESVASPGPVFVWPEPTAAPAAGVSTFLPSTDEEAAGPA